MKTSIWMWASDARPRRKCVWSGELSHIPERGSQIVVLDGYCCETVDQVVFDISSNTVEIHLSGFDNNNEYPEVPLS